MTQFKKTLCLVLVCVLLLPSLTLRAESVDDKFTQISPHFTPGGGEFVHGQGYGKLLMRILIFGAVPNQGIHYMPEGTDLMFGIIYAGGKNEFTKLSGITIRRRGVTELMKVDLEDLVNDGKPIPRLVDGDVISVPYNWRKDTQEFLFISGLLGSVTSLILSLVALSQIHR